MTISDSISKLFFGMFSNQQGDQVVNFCSHGGYGRDLCLSEECQEFDFGKVKRGTEVVNDNCSALLG